MTDEFKALEKFDAGKGREGLFFSLPALEEQGIGKISRLPVSIRIVLESVLRNCDGKKVRRKDVEALAKWNAKSPANEGIPFVVARIVLQDFTGVPLIVDLAAMRSAVQRLGSDPKIIEPLVPVDLVVDHSVQVDFFGSPRAFELNLDMEFKRNRERYQFLNWGQQAFKTFQLIPPGIGIVHQVNLEYLAKGVLSQTSDIRGHKAEIFFPDTLVGTDSHTTMIDGLGVVGWGVGGIEAEAGMLGQPVYFLTPEVVGVHMTGALREGVTATDLVLHITQMLRAQKVVGKFVEFYGEGTASLPVPDRATIGNMSPEYGATMGFFPIDKESVAYLRATGRTDDQCAAFENYFRAQKMFGMPRKGEIDYSIDLELNLAEVQPGVAGPKRPQDRINLPALGETFRSLLQKPVKDGGYGIKDVEFGAKHLVELNGSPPSDGNMPSTDKNGPAIEPGEERNKAEMVNNRPTPDTVKELKDSSADPFHHGESRIGHGSVLIAAITSCTNTSNPSVMLAAGLLAKKAVERELWPSLKEVRDAMQSALKPEIFRKLYRDFADQNPKWNEIPSSKGDVYVWDEKSDYIHEPPFFQDFSMDVGKIDNITGARVLGIFGDSVTTDHISPAGAIKATSPAGQYLISRGIKPEDFNSYGSRRGNDLVMTRGTFANVRIKNLMDPGTEGGVTKHYPDGEQMSIFDAAMRYQKEKVPLVILAGHEYGTGSSRDWAAKGTKLLGVKAVVAASFERIHRSNLVGMGVLPLQFLDGVTAQSLGLDGSQTFSIGGLSDAIQPGQRLTMEIESKDRQKRYLPLKLRIDTPIEIDYYKHGGILPFVLRQLLAK